MKKPLIKVENIFKDFKVGKNTVSVLKDIDLSIYPGEFVIIFGPSGCGKSTLLNVILGLEAPTTGKVFIEGEDIYAKDEDERTRFRRNKLGVVYQQPNWIKALNVIENTAFPLNITNVSMNRAKKRAKNILSMFGFEQYLDYVPTELSGGQQQRVSVCRALITNPLIVLADEPTGNLDTSSAEDLMNVFKYLNDEPHKTIVLVSHNPEYEKFATKVVYIRDGSIERIVKKKEVSRSKPGQDLLEIALEQE